MRLNSKITRIVAVTVLLICLIWAATPKVYIHQLLNHRHEVVNTNGETSIKNETNQDCDIEKYNTPLYFTIFKFINNFIPLKPKQETSVLFPNSFYNSYIVERDSSRAPPRA